MPHNFKPSIAILLSLPSAMVLSAMVMQELGPWLSPYLPFPLPSRPKFGYPVFGFIPYVVLILANVCSPVLSIAAIVYCVTNHGHHDLRRALLIFNCLALVFFVFALSS